MVRFAWRDKVIGFVMETTYGTDPGSGYVYLPAEVDIPEHVREIEDYQLTTSQVGAYEPPVVGSKHGATFSLRMPIRALKSGYDPTTQTPGVTSGVISSELLLLANAMGSDADSAVTAANFNEGLHLANNAAGYASSDVAAGTTAGVVNVQAGNGANYATGDLFVGASSTSDTIPQVGFIKSIAGDALTLFEDANNTSAANDDSYPSAAGYISGAEPRPLTFHIQGDDTKFGLIYTGCVCTEVSFEGTSGKVETLVLSYRATDYRWDPSAGGLEDKANFVRLPPLLGGRGGYMTMDGSEVCGLVEPKLTITNTIKDIPCPSRASGYSDFVITDREMSFEFSIEHKSTDTIDSDGDHVYESNLVAGTAMSIGLYSANQVGKILALLFPAWHIKEQPKLSEIDGLVYHSLVLRPGENTLDGSAQAGDAANSIFRFAVA